MLRKLSVFATAALGEDQPYFISKRMGAGRGGDVASNLGPRILFCSQMHPTPALEHWLSSADSNPCKDACVQAMPHPCIPREKERKPRHDRITFAR